MELILVVLKVKTFKSSIQNTYFTTFYSVSEDLLFVLHASVCKSFSHKMLLVNLLMVNHKCFGLVDLLHQGWANYSPHGSHRTSVSL